MNRIPSGVVTPHVITPHRGVGYSRAGTEEAHGAPRDAACLHASEAPPQPAPRSLRERLGTMAMSAIALFSALAASPSSAAAATVSSTTVSGLLQPPAGLSPSLGHAFSLQDALTGLSDAARDVGNHYQAQEGQVAAVQGGGEALRERGRQVRERLSHVDPATYMVQGEAGTPSRPTLGRRLFAGADLGSWQSGESWALAPDHTRLGIGVSGGMSSSLAVDEWQGLAEAGARMDPVDPDSPDVRHVVGVLRGEPSARISGGLDLEYRSPYFDVRLRGQGGVAGATEDTGGVLDMYSQYAGLAPRLEQLGRQLTDVAANTDATAIQTDLVDVAGRLQALDAKYRSGAMTSAEYVAALGQMKTDLAAMQPRIQALSLAASRSGVLLGDASRALSALGSTSSQSRLEIAYGAQGTLEVVGRMPVATDGRTFKNVHVAVKGEGHFLAPNPSYDASRHDAPQMEYLLGAVRTNAHIAVSGVEHLSQTLGSLQQTQQQLSQTLGNIGKFVEQSVTALAGLTDSASARRLVEIYQDQQDAGGALPPDLAEVVTLLRGLTQDVRAMETGLPELEPVLQDATRLTELGNQTLDDLERLADNFRVATDLVTRVVTPTSPFGAGVGIGVGGTLVLDPDARHLPKEVNLAVTVDNVFGYLRGSEQVWRLDTPHLSQTGEARFNRVSSETRNVYADFNPMTTRVTADATLPSSGTRLIAGGEKIDGLEGMSTYLGVEQPVGSSLRLRAGVYQPADSDATVRMVGLGLGGERGLRLDVGLASEDAGTGTREAHGNLKLEYRF